MVDVGVGLWFFTLIEGLVACLFAGKMLPTPKSKTLPEPMACCVIILYYTVIGFGSVSCHSLGVRQYILLLYYTTLYYCVLV